MCSKLVLNVAQLNHILLDALLLLVRSRLSKDNLTACHMRLLSFCGKD